MLVLKLATLTVNRYVQYVVCGSTWCRYGGRRQCWLSDSTREPLQRLTLTTQDRLRFLLQFRGMCRSPIKRLWHYRHRQRLELYICGNGGMRPRHGDLFATDLDETTLLQYIDRTWWYTRTADRLQRTSAGGWENLEVLNISNKSWLKTSSMLLKNLRPISPQHRKIPVWMENHHRKPWKDETLPALHQQWRDGHYLPSSSKNQSKVFLSRVWALLQIHNAMKCSPT